MEPSEHSFDVTADAFERDVLERSRSVPILVEFWATWCGPCKQLKPVLQQLARDYRGAFELGLVDVDAQPSLATALQIRSVPTVMLVKDGQLVDGFPGVLPAAQLREFLAAHGIEPAAGESADNDPPTADAPDPATDVPRLRARVAAEPGEDEPRLELAIALLENGDDIDEAEQLLDALPPNFANDDRARSAKARLAFLQRLRLAPARAELERRIGGDAGDTEAALLLGMRLVVDGEAEAGLEQLLGVLEVQRGDSEARKALLDAFVIIADAELVGRSRRRMATILF